MMLQLWFLANSIFWQFGFDVYGFKLGLNVILLLIVGSIWLGLIMRSSPTTFSIRFSLMLLAYFLVSGFVAAVGPCHDKFLKMALTAPVLFFLSLVGFEIGKRATDADWLRLQTSARWILVVTFVGFIAEMLNPTLFPHGEPYRIQGKYSGIFLEPSHVAFSLFPSCAILLLAEGRSRRWLGVLALFGLLALSYSTTLVALICLWVVYRIILLGRKVPQTDIAVGLLAGIMLASSFGGQSIERLTGVASVRSAQNPSSLVYQQGWEDAWANLQRTHGMGLGFNMMGCQPVPDVPARRSLATQFHFKLNTEDGSFLLSKLVSEAGIIGISFFILVVWWWSKLTARIRELGNTAAPVAQISSSLIFCLIATSLIRSAGYFSGGPLMLVVAVAASMRWWRSTAQIEAASSPKPR